MALTWEQVLCFRSLVKEVAEELSDKDREGIIYLYGLPASFDHTTSSGLALLRELEMRGIISSSAQWKLVEVLKRLRRKDLVSLAKHRMKEDSKKLEKKAKHIRSGKLQCTQKDIRYRTQFDHAKEQTGLLGKLLEQLTADIVNDGDAHHKKAKPHLEECKEYLMEFQDSLQAARRAAKVSDSNLLVVPAEFEDRPGSPTSPPQEASPAPSPVTCRKATKTKKKVPPVPPPKPAGHPGVVDHTVPPHHPEAEAVEDLYDEPVPVPLPKPMIVPRGTLPRTGTQSAPISPAPRVRRQSQPAKFHAAQTGTPPAAPSRIHTQFAKELESKLTLHHVPVQETARSPVQKPEHSDTAEYDDLTGGSTGDSGFGESRDFLKFPIPPKPHGHEYTPLQQEGLDNDTDEYIVPDIPLYDDVR